MTGASISGMGALVIRYYSTGNYVERDMLKEVMKRGIALDGEARQDLADRIISALGQALDGKRKGTRAH